jgi:ATP-dependent helicase/nuclease subunit A
VVRGVLDVHEEAAGSLERSVEGFLSSPAGVRMVSSPCVKREKPFVEARTVQGERVLLQGVIDCYFQEGDELVLLDYKTGGGRFASEREAVRQYEAQLIAYRDALQRLTGKAVRNTYLCLLDRDWYIEIE